MEVARLQSSQPVADAVINTFALGIERGGDHKARRQCQRDCHQPLVGEPACLGGDDGDDQAKLREVGERQGREQGGTHPQVSAAVDQIVEDTFERQGQHQRQRQQHCVVGRQAVEADGEKEADQKEVFEVEERLGKPCRSRMRGEQHADDEGPQIRLEADYFKTGGPDHQRQKDSEQHLQLAVTGPLQQLEQQRAQQR